MDLAARAVGPTVVVAAVVVAAASLPGVGVAQTDEPAYPSAEWTAREADNYARTTEAPRDQATDPAFLERWQAQSLANFLEAQERRADDPDWRSEGNLCSTYAEQCTGDPYRYPGVDAFYDEVGVVEPVAFLDRGGARLSGRVWAPIGARPGDGLPGVVIVNGSVQAPETLYWWGAQALVAQGYVVLTFDPRGQGRSDNRTPDGEAGSNANPDVFVTNLIDAIDFFLSTSDAHYPPNLGDDRATTPHNPFADVIDPGRLGIVGHSLGARGVSVVQGIEPWPGSAGPDNPVDVAVAWDNLALEAGGGDDLAGYPIVPRVPAMGQAGDYFLTPTPFTEPPDPDDKRRGYLQWQEADVPAYQLVIRGGTHYEWSLLPTFPTTRWEPGGEGGWGVALARHYTVAWLDRWLKRPGEVGYADADARLLADDADVDGATWRDRLSFYHRSSRSFPDREGARHVCDDIRRGCPPVRAAGDVAADADPAADRGDAADDVALVSAPRRHPLPATGGGRFLLGLALVGAAYGLRGRGRPRQAAREPVVASAGRDRANRTPSSSSAPRRNSWMSRT